ncbi:hypothetical protein Tco_0322938 [Tanacetum coccineum]
MYKNDWLDIDRVVLFGTVIQSLCEIVDLYRILIVEETGDVVKQPRDAVYADVFKCYAVRTRSMITNAYLSGVASVGRLCGLKHLHGPLFDYIAYLDVELQCHELSATVDIIYVVLVKPSTSASGSQPSGNTKKDKIQQTPSSTQKNKVEAHPRKVKSSLKNKDHALAPKGTAHVQHSKLNVNSELKCVKCNGCMLFDNHDLCVLDYINNVNARAKSKSAKTKVQREKFGNQQERITTTTEVPLRKPTALENETPKPVVTLVYSRKPRKFKTNVPISKSKVVQIVLWYLDSGCSKHMTGDRSQLTNFVNKFLGTVKFGNDHVVKILDYGDYQIGNVMISRVYYVEGLGHNLFFVGQFCDSNLEVAFRQHTYFIRNLEGVDLLTGSRGNNLYTLSLGDMMASSPICLLSKASKTKSWLWHRPVMFSASSVVTYTSVYTDSKPWRFYRGSDEEPSDVVSPGVIIYGYDEFPMHPVALPSLDYVPGPEHPPSPDYVPALSPGNVADSDPEEDPEEDHADYPTDGGDGDDESSDDDDDDDEADDDNDEASKDEDDDKEEDEHLAPADSSAVPVIPSPSLPVPSPPLPLPSPPTTSPTYAEVPLGYRAARIRMRAASPPLLLPSISYRTDIPEAEMLPWKRACFTTPASRFEVGESSAAAAARQPGPTLEVDLRRDMVMEMGYGITDT